MCCVFRQECSPFRHALPLFASLRAVRHAGWACLRPVRRRRQGAIFLSAWFLRRKYAKFCAAAQNISAFLIQGNYKMRRGRGGKGFWQHATRQRQSGLQTAQITNKRRRRIPCVRNSPPKLWRYPADSNCCTRFCRPLPSHSVRVPNCVCRCGAYGTRTRDPMRDRHVF
jgi:hypothetical protein